MFSYSSVTRGEKASRNIGNSLGKGRAWNTTGADRRRHPVKPRRLVPGHCQTLDGKEEEGDERILVGGDFVHAILKETEERELRQL